MISKWKNETNPTKNTPNSQPVILSFFHCDTALWPINYAMKMFSAKMSVAKMLQPKYPQQRQVEFTIPKLLIMKDKISTLFIMYYATKESDLYTKDPQIRLFHATSFCYNIDEMVSTFVYTS